MSTEQKELLIQSHDETKQIVINDEVLQYAAFISARKKYWTSDLDKLLRKWQRQISRRREGHKAGERRYKTVYLSLGIPSVILAAIISAAVFGTFKNCECTENCYTDEWVRIISGVIALLSAILTAVISFIDAGGTREKHKNSADTYDQLSHQIDSILQTSSILRGDPTTVVEGIRTGFDNAVKDSPYIDSNYETTLTYKIKSPAVVRKHKREVSANTSSHEEIVNIPQQDIAVFDMKRVSFDKGLLKSLNFELGRLNTPGEEDSEEKD